MEWRTRITEMLGIKYPLIQGAFGSFGNADSDTAVSAETGTKAIGLTAISPQ